MDARTHKCTITGDASQTPEQMAGHPMREDKSPYKYLGSKNEILAYSWRLVRALTVSGHVTVLCYRRAAGQVPAVLAAGDW